MIKLFQLIAEFKEGYIGRLLSRKKWLAQGDDFRTFLAALVSSVQQFDGMMGP
jgi:hypothetical protein